MMIVHHHKCLIMYKILNGYRYLSCLVRECIYLVFPYALEFDSWPVCLCVLITPSPVRFSDSAHSFLWKWNKTILHYDTLNKDHLLYSLFFVIKTIECRQRYKECDEIDNIFNVFSSMYHKLISDILSNRWRHGTYLPDHIRLCSLWPIHRIT